MDRAVLALKISDNPAADEQEPAVMLSASIHGDELAGFVLLMRLAEYLASESSSRRTGRQTLSQDWRYGSTLLPILTVCTATMTP
ncbi:MAG: succinylglutamate desuccinylase/aspartoacylase family protein [Marinilabiliales bacterium]|nr:succinylglutamate desuccinylase/aspartoacylase family protein [Marinilabiliales bacterium]